MFILAKDQKVVMGPMQYNVGMFAHALKELGVSFEFPNTRDTFLQIEPGLALYPVTVTPAALNSKIEQPVGPVYTFTADSAVASFTAAPKSLDMVKGELKAIAASERYTKEMSGATVTLQGQEVKVSTTREDRANFLVNANGGDNWKFLSGWILMTEQDVAAVSAAVKTSVQQAFDWEASINQQIDACEDLASLDALVIVEVQEPGMPA